MTAGRLRKRSWLLAQGLPLIMGAVTLGGAVAAVAVIDLERQQRSLALAAVIAVGFTVYLLARRRYGAAAIQRQLTQQRTQRASTQEWAFQGGESPAHPDTVALALPRGWRSPIVHGSMHGQVQSRQALVQSWVLRSVAGSRRQTSTREVVVVGARTGQYRCAVTTGLSIDPAVLTPAWVNLRTRTRAEPGLAGVLGDSQAIESWGEALRAAVQTHQDLPFTLIVGGDQVIILALDDPRIETAQARLELATAVANIVDPAGAVPRGGPELI